MNVMYWVAINGEQRERKSERRWREKRKEIREKLMR